MIDLAWNNLDPHRAQNQFTLHMTTVAPIGLPRPLRLLADKNVFIHDEISFGSGQHGYAIIMKISAFKKVLGEIEIGEFAKEGS